MYCYNKYRQNFEKSCSGMERLFVRYIYSRSLLQVGRSAASLHLTAFPARYQFPGSSRHRMPAYPIMSDFFWYYVEKFHMNFKNKSYDRRQEVKLL